MWYAFLQNNYKSRAEFREFSEVFGLAERLGYADADAAWDDNPFIQGGTSPADFAKVDMRGFRDGEVLGFDADDNLICWDVGKGAPYNSGTSLDDYGDKNLTAAERKRLGIVWLATDA